MVRAQNKKHFLTNSKCGLMLLYQGESWSPLRLLQQVLRTSSKSSVVMIYENVTVNKI